MALVDVWVPSWGHLHDQERNKSIPLKPLGWQAGNSSLNREGNPSSEKENLPKYRRKIVPLVGFFFRRGKPKTLKESNIFKDQKAFFWETHSRTKEKEK
jgi:hypothetical protein